MGRYRLGALGAIFGATLLTLCMLAFQAGAAPEALRTEVSGIPWDARPLENGAKVVHGSDDRIDIYEETDPLRLAEAASTCGLLGASHLQANGDGRYAISTSAY